MLQGSVYDVAVDLRGGSPTFGQWRGETLTADGGEQLFVPVGFAASSAGEYCFTLFGVVAIALIASWVVAVLFTPLTGVFIRAPWIESCGEGVQVLAEHGGHAVAAQQGSVLVTAFHPELTGDRRLHRRFAEMVERARGAVAA